MQDFNGIFSKYSLNITVICGEETLKNFERRVSTLFGQLKISERKFDLIVYVTFFESNFFGILAKRRSELLERKKQKRKRKKGNTQKEIESRTCSDGQKRACDARRETPRERGVRYLNFRWPLCYPACTRPFYPSRVCFASRVLVHAESILNESKYFSLGSSFVPRFQSLSHCNVYTAHIPTWWT